MPDRSPLQNVSNNVFARIQALREEKIDPQPPFGFENVNKTEAKRRLKNMSPDGRKQLINKIGLDNVFKLIGD